MLHDVAFLALFMFGRSVSKTFLSGSCIPSFVLIDRFFSKVHFFFFGIVLN